VVLILALVYEKPMENPESSADLKIDPDSVGIH
jgi:hypothetical protein